MDKIKSISNITGKIETIAKELHTKTPRLLFGKGELFFAICDRVYVYDSIHHYKAEHKYCMPLLTFKAEIVEDKERSIKHEIIKEILTVMKSVFSKPAIFGGPSFGFIYDVKFDMNNSENWLITTIQPLHGRMYTIRACESIRLKKNAKRFLTNLEEKMRQFLERDDVFIEFVYEVHSFVRGDYGICAGVYVFIAPQLFEIIRIFDT